MYVQKKKIGAGQDITFLKYCNDHPAAVINTYNGSGISSRPVYYDKFTNQFNKFIRRYNNDKNNKKITYETENGIYIIKNMTIRDYYQICKDSDHLAVITIGMDLLSRGISFVSTEKVYDALAATTMIYVPGNTMHGVGLCQTIGRICGTARPDLQRRLYASESVITNYKYFNTNQKQYLKELRDNQGILSNQIMSKIIFNNKLTRPVDRPKVGIKFNYKIDVEAAERANPVGLDDTNMKRLIDLWWKKNTIIGKILTFVYESGVGVSENELKEYLQEIGSDNVGEMYRHLTRKTKEYFYVFRRSSNGVTNLQPNARTYISSK